MAVAEDITVPGLGANGWIALERDPNGVDVSGMTSSEIQDELDNTTYDLHFDESTEWDQVNLLIERSVTLIWSGTADSGNRPKINFGAGDHGIKIRPGSADITVKLIGLELDGREFGDASDDWQVPERHHINVVLPKDGAGSVHLIVEDCFFSWGMTFIHLEDQHIRLGGVPENTPGKVTGIIRRNNHRYSDSRATRNIAVRLDGVGSGIIGKDNSFDRIGYITTRDAARETDGPAPTATKTEYAVYGSHLGAPSTWQCNWVTNNAANFSELRAGGKWDYNVGVRCSVGMYFDKKFQSVIGNLFTDTEDLSDLGGAQDDRGKGHILLAGVDGAPIKENILMRKGGSLVNQVAIDSYGGGVYENNVSLGHGRLIGDGGGKGVFIHGGSEQAGTNGNSFIKSFDDSAIAGQTEEQITARYARKRGEWRPAIDHVGSALNSSRPDVEAAVAGYDDSGDAAGDSAISDTSLPVLVFNDNIATAAGAGGLDAGAPGNASPVAEAGTNKTITQPTSSTSVTGTDSDSDGTIASRLWSFAGGPVTPTIVSPTSATTSVTGLDEPGLYTLTYTVTDDDGATDTDSMTITVEAVEPANTPPTAYAGVDQSGTLPLDGILLDGTTTDGDGTVASVQWAYVSGPSPGVTIQSATSEQAVAVNFTNAGPHTFLFTVTDDGGLTDTDSVTFNIGAAPVNEPPTASAGSDTTSTTLGEGITLSGSDSDDGEISHRQWSFISGPAPVTIASPTSKTTGATGFTNYGVYSFAYTVTDDTGLSDTDIRTHTVNPEGESTLSDITTNKAGEWRFNDDLLDSIASADFTASGGTPTYTDGIDGRSVVLASGTTLDAGNVTEMNIGGDGAITYEGWFKTSAAPGSTSNLFRKKANYSAGAAGIVFAVDSDGDYLIQIADGTSYSQLFYSGLKFNADAGWVHLAVVVDLQNNVFALYVNGELATSTPNAGDGVAAVTTLSTTSALQLVQQGVAPAWASTVTCSRFGTYLRALTTKDIRALYVKHIYTGAGSETLDFEDDFGATPNSSAAAAANGTLFQRALALWSVYPSMTITIQDNFWIDMPYSRCDSPSNASLLDPDGTGKIIWVGADSGIEFWKPTGTTTNTVSEVTISPLPFVQGTVADPGVEDGTQIVVDMDEVWPADLPLQVEWIETLDPATLIAKPEQLNWGESWFGTPVLSNGDMTVTIPITTGVSGHEAGIILTVGDRIVVDVHKNGTSGFDYHRGEHFNVTENTTRAACRVAHMFRQCSGDIRINNVAVIPEEGKLRSAGGTAYNFSANRGTLIIDGYENQRAGDDPLNMWTPYMAVASVSSLQFVATPDPQMSDFKVGDVLEFYSGDVIDTSDPDDLDALGTATVESIQVEPDTWNGAWTITVASGGHTPVNGQRFVNLTARFTEWQVRNVDWNYLRSRGAIIQMSNGLFEDFLIQNHTQAAVLIGSNITSPASSGAAEGHRPSNIVIRNGTINNCNFGTAIDWGGVISAFAGTGPSDVQKVGFYQNINIYRMTILANEADSGVAIALRSVYGGFVGNNAISGYATEVLIDESSINIGQPPAPNAMIPSVLNYGLVDSDGNLKPGLVNTSYSGGSGDAETLKPSLLTPEGKLKPSLVDADQRVKPSMLRKN